MLATLEKKIDNWQLGLVKMEDYTMEQRLFIFQK